MGIESFGFEARTTSSKFFISTFKGAVYVISKRRKFLIASFAQAQTHKFVKVFLSNTGLCVAFERFRFTL